MPPFLVALVAAGIILLIPRKKTAVIVQSTPFNGGVGITSGFAAPAVQSTVSSPISNTLEKNQPSTSGSGVPDYTSQTQEFNTAPPSMVPSPGFVAYYHPAQRGLLRPISAMASKGQANRAGGSCGCGDKKDAASDCKTNRRGADNGCLAPSRKAQIKNTPPQVFAQWSDNISSSGYGMFDVIQHGLSTVQNEAPANEYNLVPAVGHMLTPIGLPANGL